MSFSLLLVCTVLRVSLSLHDQLVEGIRSLSKYYEEHPYSTDINGSSKHARMHSNRLELAFLGETLTVEYAPAESRTNMFGGNSNWRGKTLLEAESCRDWK